MYECVEAFIEKDDLDLYKKMGFDNPQLIELIKLSWQAAQVKGLPEELVYGIYGNFDFVPDKEGDMKSVGNKGDVVVVFSDTAPTDEVMGQAIFKVIHQKSKEEIYVSLEDLEEK